MDTQLKELIETIKTEGVESAEKQAQQIVTSAEQKAHEITENARKQAQGIVDDAKRDRARQEAAGKEAVKQAARDLVLNVQAQLTSIFRDVVEEATRDALDAGALERAIETVVRAWAEGNEGNIEILLGQKDLESLELSLRARLAKRLSSGTEIKAAPGIKGGFRIASRDGGVYYDFTADAITEGLCAYLTPRLADTIRDAARGA
jgi:V/A-type H+/Na+-transporting ATPase subunit E